MPRLSEKRAEESERLEQVLKVLNGEYHYLTMLNDIRENEGVDPLDRDPDSEWLYIKAEYRMRRKLTEWVERWHTTGTQSPDDDRDNYVAEYIAANPKLRTAFHRTTRAWGISAEVFRELIAFQPRTRIAGQDPFNFRVRIFSRLLEEAPGFLGSDDPLLSADAEAMRLFIVLLRSKLSDQLRRCPAENCGKYFLNLGGRREFCCRAHAQQRINKGLLRQLKRKRDDKKAEAIARANQTLRRCKSRDWKRWVARRTGLTRTFLTRNQKYLNVPKELR